MNPSVTLEHRSRCIALSARYQMYIEMKTILVSDEASMEVTALPEQVWSLVSNVSRMGEWSPICRRCEWLGEPAAVVGARFVGHNRQAGARWSRECVVTTSEPGREFAFHTVFRGQPGTRWRYRFEPIASGTRVTESYEVLSMPRWVRALRRLPGMKARSRRDAHRGMQHTLERVRAAAQDER